MIFPEYPINLAVYQPVIPKYRVPFLNALSCRKEINLEVFASKYIHGFQPSSKDNYQFRYTPVSAFGLGKGIFWQSGLRVPAYFKKGDVIVLSGMPKFLNLYPLIIAAKIRRVGIIWWGHGFSAGPRGWSVNIRQKIMRLADVILLYTDQEVRAYRHAGFASERLFATNNTIDTSDIELVKNEWSSRRLEKFQEEQGLLKTKNIIFCGRLTGKAHLDVALEALVELLKGDLSYRFIIIGDGPEKNALSARCRELNIDYAVKWLGAMYDNHELAPWFLSAFVFVYPGSIGLSFLHSFAFGRTVITHSAPEFHMPEFAALKNGENGLTFKFGDHQGLASNIRYLSVNVDKRIQMQANALATIQNEFSFNGMVERFFMAVNAASSIVSDCKQRFYITS